MLLHIHGKGSNDRMVPLPPRALQRLRQLWLTHRSSRWLFPRRTQSGHAYCADTNAEPITRSALQAAFLRAVRAAGITKKAHVHTLRHYPAHRIIPCRHRIWSNAELKRGGALI
jgi:site-specific recombinase XerD